MLLIAISLLWFGVCSGLLNESSTARASRGEERRSCLRADSESYLHIWGADGGDELKSTFSVHNSTVAMAAAAQGKPVRVAINLALNVPECPRCPQFMIAPMDILPEETATKAVESMVSSLDPDSKAKLDFTMTKSALTTKVREAQVVQYKAAVAELMEYLHFCGVDTTKIEGSTSSFLEKVRFMQAAALGNWPANNHINNSFHKIVCEVGFNAGHSALLWLLAGATRVISFELGQYNYSQLAAGWLLDRFPGRLNVVLGDSFRTVPTFRTMFPHEVCDIVLVDGGHTTEAAWGDLVHLKEFVEVGSDAKNGHIVLVDDSHMPGVGAAWKQAQEKGLVVEDGQVESQYAEINDVPFSVDLQWNGQYVTESPEAINPPWAGNLAFGRYLL